MSLIFSVLFALILICLTTILVLLLIGQRSHSPNQLMVIMGSGGHTAEMMTLLSSISSLAEMKDDDEKKKKKNIPSKVGELFSCITEIVFIVQKEDSLSQEKLSNAYPSVNKESSSSSSSINYRMLTITRSRSVHQSYLSSIPTTLISLYQALSIMIQNRPGLLLCNGPAVCVPMIVSARILSPRSVVVFVESFCRTRSLSLSGKIIYHLRLAHHFLVQWPKLVTQYSRSRFLGLLV